MATCLITRKVEHLPRERGSIDGAAFAELGSHRALVSATACSSAPYLGRTPRALADKLHVWERGSDMVLAAHFTRVKCGTTTTLETVRFERPNRIDFRLVRGPVPHLVESFLLEPGEHGTTFRWHGELGTDGWRLGKAWGRIVARAWTRAVEDSLRQIAAEAERRAGHSSDINDR